MMIEQIQRELSVASRLDPYNGFEQAYVCLVKLALDEPETEEFARIKRLAAKLTASTAARVLRLPQVDQLLDIEPPLETLASHEREELHSLDIGKAIETVRATRHSNPKKALRSLLYILKIIRNKRDHGFKSAEGPRDQEILGAAHPIVVELAECCIVLLLPLREAR